MGWRPRGRPASAAEVIPHFAGRLQVDFLLFRGVRALRAPLMWTFLGTCGISTLAECAGRAAGALLRRPASGRALCVLFDGLDPSGRSWQSSPSPTPGARSRPKPIPYLTLDGTTKGAFAFYAKVLRYTIEFSQTFDESSMNDVLVCLHRGEWPAGIGRSDLFYGKMKFQTFRRRQAPPWDLPWVDRTFFAIRPSWKTTLYQ